MRVALDVPPFRRSRWGEGALAPRKMPPYMTLDGAETLRTLATVAWSNAGQPCPPIEIEVVDVGQALMDKFSGSSGLTWHLPRVRAIGGVPAGYRGRTRTL